MQLIGFPKRNSAFTIIELLVVVSIISILSSIVMKSLNSARDKATDATIKQGLIQMRNAYELVYSSNNSYTPLTPPTVLDGSYQNATDLFCQYFTAGTRSGYDCTVMSITGCSTLYTNDSQTSAIACKDLVSKTSQFKVGITSNDSSNVANKNTQYAILAKYKSNNNYFCVRYTGKIIESLPNSSADNCFDISNNIYPW